MRHHTHTQPCELALQAVPQLINNKRLKWTRLTDCLTPTLSRPTGLLDPFNGMSCPSIPHNMPTIHNYQLSINIPQQYIDTVALLSSASSTSLPHQCDQMPNHAQKSQKRVENQKMAGAIFSVFDLKKTRPCGTSLVKAP
jgi:hypothetical protein